MDHAVFYDQRATERSSNNSVRASAITKAIYVEMTKNDDSRACVDRDRATGEDVHISDVAGATVDGERTGDGYRAVSAAGETIDLNDAALVIGSLKRGTRGGSAASIGVVAAVGNPQDVLRLDRACRNQQHHREKRGAHQNDFSHDLAPNGLS